MFLSWPAFGLAERASLVIEADTGLVLHAKNARLRTYPASLTKLMTVYLLCEAIEAGHIALKEKLSVSAYAERQMPPNLGLRRGETITVKEVLLALIVRSANGAAVVAAERLAGGESAFAKIMTDRARALCMSDTVFRNASGLPNSKQVTSARDMALMAQALRRDFPQYYPLFSVKSFRYRGRTFHTHNHFMNDYEGADGLKTGFTRGAGYNLVASAVRKGRRLIGVVLGEKSAGRRDARMAKVLDDAFGRKNADESLLTIDTLVRGGDHAAGSPPNGHADIETCVAGIGIASGWSLAIGVRKEEPEARALAWAIIRKNRERLRGARPLIVPFLRGVLLYRACITGLKRDDAIAACKHMRERDDYCIVMGPKMARAALDKGRVALERARQLMN